MTQKEFGAAVIASLQENPEAWVFGSHNARVGTVDIWIANRPYADLTLGSSGPRIGTRWQRRKIRRLMDPLRFSREAARLEEAHAELEKVSVDSVLERLAKL